MVKYFSKWIELVALPQNSSELAAKTFFNCILAKFGIHAEVLIDQGKMFFRSFEEPRMNALIDYHTTSRDH